MGVDSLIQLYTSSNQDISKNGILLDPLSCEITPVINGANELVMQIIIDKGNLYKQVARGAIITVPTPDFIEPQAYRIYDTEKSMSGNTITVYARHIFFDLNRKIIFNKTVQGSGTEVLKEILKDTKFIGSSSSAINDFAQYKMQTITNVINGSEEDSFINKWGGEIQCNNYNLNILQRIGADHNVNVTFGYNLEDIEESINIEDMATRIYPYSGELVLHDSKPYVDSPLISSYNDIYEQCVEMNDIKVIERTFDSEGNETTSESAEGFETIDDARAEMIKRCNELFINGIDKPTVNYTVKMKDLSKTTEYKKLGYDVLEKISLGDTVHCFHKDINIEVAARCISYTWDCINKEFISIELGQFLNNFLSDSSSKINNLYKEVQLQKQEILLKVDSLDNTMTSEIKITEDKISSKVEKDELGSLITQEPESVGIAFNNISNYAKITAADGLILGDEKNGTYSQIGYDGRMQFMMNGKKTPYHSLVYVGSKAITCTAEDYTTITVPLPEIFKGISESDISVVVSIKKVYDSNLSGLYLPYWFGAYASIKSGNVVFDVMSKWRKVLKNDTVGITGIDSPVNGKIDIVYTIIA